jgi:hypothetical protein
VIEEDGNRYPGAASSLTVQAEFAQDFVVRDAIPTSE